MCEHCFASTLKYLDKECNCQCDLMYDFYFCANCGHWYDNSSKKSKH